MVKAVIIDNERFVIDDVREKLSTHFSSDIEIVSDANSVKTGLAAITKYNPDLLFLDVNMDDGTGFDLLEQCTDKHFEIIFVTGYDQHAIKAIKVGALDYILKPIDDDEFKIAVKKAIDNNLEETNLEKLIEISSEYFKGVEKKRVILKTSDMVYAVYEDDITYCRSDGNYTTFYTQQLEKIVISKPIKYVEEILTDDCFIRCHQSYIVNKKYVLKYNKQGTLILSLDIKVPVSSRRKNYTLLKIFG
jgi:two-component system LytT family response regulator